MRAGDITVGHAYQISRLADRNVGPKKLLGMFVLVVLGIAAVGGCRRR